MASAFRDDVIHGGRGVGVESRGGDGGGGGGRRRAGGGESGTESTSEGGGGGRGCFGGSRELSVPDRVAQIFYSHGLFVSSHPWALICFVITVVLLCCYPLLNLPLPGNVPQELLTPVTNYSVPGLRPLDSGNSSNGPITGKNPSEPPIIEGQHPWWYRGSPVSYIQQIVVKSAVTPWADNLILTDAFRAPLAEVFDLLEVIRNYQNIIRGRTLSQLCLHVEAVKTKSGQRQSMVLPEYNCLLLSPANLWQQDKSTFQADPTLLSTIFNYQSIQKGKISLAELLFGMSMKDTGIKRYPLRTRQRVVQYAITIILKDYDPIYLDGLKHKLTSLHQSEPGKGSTQGGEGGEGSDVAAIQTDDAESILHIYYPGYFNLHRMFPLLATYVVLFLYIYFSVRKMELVRSKIGVALAAVSTVLASLCMSVGLCFFFGLALSLDGGDGKGSARRDYYPYLVAVVGLENVLVLTRAAISTPPHLDTKIRIARALSREGWSITKNLLAEVTILTIGFFTFVPAIQEFCIFLVVGLLSDFFLQMMFFATVLAVDIRRLESLEAQNHRHHHHHVGYSSFPVENQIQHKGWPSADEDGMSSLFWPGLCFGSSSRPQKQKLSRSRSHPRLLNGGYPADVVAPGGHGVTASPVVGSAKFASSTLVAKLPKRLKLLYFWARTRIIQRAFMFGMVVWISVIVYNTGIVDRLAYVDQGSGGHEEAVAPPRNDSGKVMSSPYSAGPFVSPVAEPDVSVSARHEQVWRNQGSSLSHRHWPALLGMYNISVSGGYLSILPPIRIWIPVAPDLALQLRHPEEKEGGGPAGQFQWQALAAALDPLDFSELESNGATTPSSSSPSGTSSSTSSTSSSAPYVPSSPMELFLTSVLCVVSVAVVSYTMVVLYRCVCSRNYAEWRASWSGEEVSGIGGQDASTQVVLEAVPLTLEGHPQEVECMASDPSGGSVASCCLAGQLRVWDRATGELLVFVDRKGFFSAQGKSPSSSAPHLENDPEEMVLSDYESGSPPSQGEGAKIASLYDLAVLPSLSHRKGSFQTNEVDSEASYQRSDAFHQKKDHHLQNGGYSFAGHGSYMSNPMMWSMPDLRPSINTNFGANRSRMQSADLQQSNTSLKQQGYDFGHHYRGLYEEHCKSAFEEDDGEMEEDETGEVETLSGVINQPRSSLLHRRSLAMKVPPRDQGLSPDGLSMRNIKSCEKKVIGNGRSRIIHSSLPTAQEHSPWMMDKSPPNKSPLMSNADASVPSTISQNGSSDRLRINSGAPPVWCIDFRDNLIALGCANGHLELWDGSSGKFKCLFEDGTGVGITSVKIIGNRVVAAKLSGSIDFFELESYRKGKQMDWSFNSYHRRTHVRTGSAGSLDWDSMLQADEDIRCVRLGSVRAHQQPITVLDSEGGRILTGSQDHTLKVFRLEDHLQMYTLHGHCGPITALFIDKMCPLLSGSGSQDGMLCVWDLVTGACMYSIQAHDGSICALSYSASYVISLGTDERLCVWERFQGHLLNTIHVSHTYCSSMVMLTHNLLITSKQGSLVVWDVRTGDPVRIVRLGNNDSCIFVKQILLLRDGGAGGWGGEALCDYGNQLRIVRFPMASTEKTD